MASYVSVSTTFYPGSPDDSSGSDIVILSSDSVWFYVDSGKLIRASENNFNGLLPTHPMTDGQWDSGAKSNINFGPIIPIPEPSQVLNILLHVIYSISLASYSPTFPDLAHAVSLLPTYGISIPAVLSPSPPSLLYTLLTTYAPYHSLDLYTLAAQLELFPLASYASQFMHSMPLSSLSDEQVIKIGPVYLKRLFFLHYGRADALKRILLAPPHPHPPVKACDYLDQRGLTRAWALASAYLAWDSRPGELSTFWSSLLRGNRLIEKSRRCNHR